MLAKQLLFFGLVLGCVIARGASARTIIVPEHEPTIQAAINEAGDGDTVCVLPGTYTGGGNVGLRVEDKRLRLTGAASPRATVIDAKSASRLLTVSGSATELVLERLTFQNGQADSGGAIISDARLLQIFGCRFEGNSARIGGALANTGHILALTHCVFRGNSAGSGGIIHLGGALVDAINCIASGNAAEDGGVFTCANSELSLMNCTVAGNTGGAIRLTATDAFVLNSILRNDASQEIASDRALEVSYTNIRGGWQGEGFGNIDADPRFISRFGFECFLSPASPCVDAGSPYIHDRVNGAHPRWPKRYPNGERSDMGAFGGDDNIEWLRYR